VLTNVSSTCYLPLFVNIFYIEMFCLTHCKDSTPKFETNIPKNETARPQSQFLHLCFVARLYLSQSVCLIGGPIAGIYKSLTDT
jgi:hypothetical protein